MCMFFKIAMNGKVKFVGFVTYAAWIVCVPFKPSLYTLRKVSTKYPIIDDCIHVK